MKMKKRTKINYTLILIAAFGIGAAIPALIGSSQVCEQHSAKSEVPYCVAPPSVPAQVTFDGKTIDLRRYDRRERMDREMMAFTYMHSTTMLLIKRANRYFPIVEPILKANGIPDDFKYLMVIESNLNHIARSPAGAAGLWQFMPGTGREFGLEVNENVDERYHIEKATVAACKYFKQAYDKYGDWMAVAAAYNAGQARISSQLEKQLASHAMDLWLVEETSRYMFRLLAAKEIFSNPQRYGFLLKREHLYPPIPYKEVTVTTPLNDLNDYARRQGITYAQLRDANPWLRETSLKNKSGKTYVLHIPTREGMYYEPQKTVAYDKRWIID
jgi:Transglycosylase SLT domain.